MSVVLGLMLVALVVGPNQAGAAPTDGVAAANMEFPIGPVGVAAIVVGFGGLVTGLVRHRRRENAAQSVKATTMPAAEPAVTDTAAA